MMIYRYLDDKTLKHGGVLHIIFDFVLALSGCVVHLLLTDILGCREMDRRENGFRAYCDKGWPDSRIAAQIP